MSAPACGRKSAARLSARSCSSVPRPGHGSAAGADRQGDPVYRAGGTEENSFCHSRTGDEHLHAGHLVRRARDGVPWRGQPQVPLRLPCAGHRREVQGRRGCHLPHQEGQLPSGRHPGRMRRRHLLHPAGLPATARRR